MLLLRLLGVFSIEFIEKAVLFAKGFYFVSIESIEWGNTGLAHRRISPSEIQTLQEALNSESKISNIRLREGEYQYKLAEAIATFHLDLRFPNVRDIIKKLFGDEKANDIQFVRKIQTILKKMEKSDVVKILPKKNPWDLQRYALTSFRFEDVDRARVVFVTEQQVKEVQSRITIALSEEGVLNNKFAAIKIFTLMVAVVVFYLVSVWSLLQPTINTYAFIPAFAVALFCSVLLGKAFSQL